MSWTPNCSATPGGGDKGMASASGYGVSGGDGYFRYQQGQGVSGRMLGGLEDERAAGSPMPRMNNSPAAELEDGGGGNGEADDLLVFGYGAKIFRDDERAKWVDQQKHLIPWMGNGDLLIDRYDCRGALTDISRYEPGSRGGDQEDNNLENEDHVENELLDDERYRDLNEEDDYDEGAYDRAIDFKRLQSAMDGMVYESQKLPTSDRQYASFQYNYNEQSHEVSIGPEPKRLHDDDAPYTKPVGLYIPEEIILPTTMKVHAIIEKTAKFIASQGNQMEIILKTKQSGNPLFEFLNHGGTLNPYYKYMVHAIRSGIYRPVEQAEQANNDNSTSTLSQLSECGSEEDLEHNYLHPSLTVNSFSLISNYPGGVSSSKHSSYSMLVSKIKGTDSPDPPVQQPATSNQLQSSFPTVGSKVSLPVTVHAPRQEKQLPSNQDQLIIEKMASYVIKNGTNFESLAMDKADPRFAFLQKSHKYHWYYLNCKERFKAEQNAVVASSQFVNYGRNNALSSVTSVATSNAFSSTMKKVSGDKEIKRKGSVMMLQGKKLIVPKDKLATSSTTGDSGVVGTTKIPEDIFTQSTLISSKDKEKPVIRFATSLSLSSTPGTSAGKELESKKQLVFTITPDLEPHVEHKSKANDSNKKDDRDETVMKKSEKQVKKEVAVAKKEPRLPPVIEIEDGEAVDDGNSISNLSPFDGEGGNASPASENGDEIMKRRLERKRKAALFLQKLKMSKPDTDVIPIVNLVEQPRNKPLTGSSLGDLLNQRLQVGEISAKKDIPPKETVEEIYVESVSNTKSSSSNSSRHSSKSRNRSRVKSSTRSRKKRRRSRSYSSTPSYSSSTRDSSNESDHRSYSKKKSKKKHRKKKKKQEKSRSSHKSGRR